MKHPIGRVVAINFNDTLTELEIKGVSMREDGTLDVLVYQAGTKGFRQRHDEESEGQLAPGAFVRAAVRTNSRLQLERDATGPAQAILKMPSGPVDSEMFEEAIEIISDFCEQRMRDVDAHEAVMSIKGVLAYARDRLAVAHLQDTPLAEVDRVVSYLNEEIRK